MRTTSFIPRLEAFEERCLPSSGIRGLVVIGPIAPVERVGVPNTRPLAGASIEVERAGSPALIAQTRSDARGHFALALRPGHYELVPRAPQPHQFFPFARPQAVTVPVSGLARVVVTFDSGIR